MRRRLKAIEVMEKLLQFGNDYLEERNA